MLKKIIAILICVALVAFGAIWIHSALESINNRNSEIAEKSSEYGRLDKAEAYQGDDLPSSIDTVSEYCVLLTDKNDTINAEAIKIFESYGIRYSTDLSNYDPDTRVNNGLDVVGSQNANVKAILMTAISSGKSFYIGVGAETSIDLYTVVNVTGLCRYLRQYIAVGQLNPMAGGEGYIYTMETSTSAIKTE